MLVLVLCALIGLLLAIAATALWLYIQARKSLRHFDAIKDLEQYKADCERSCNEAIGKTQRLAGEAQVLGTQIAEQKTKVAQYQKLLGNLRTAVDLQQRIKSDAAKVQQLTATLGTLDHASKLNEYVRKQESAIAQRKIELDQFGQAIGHARSVSELVAKAKYYENYIEQLKADVAAVEEVGELQQFGFYRPQFDFDASDEYKKHLDKVRSAQKSMLKHRTACLCATEWTVDGDKRQGKKMVDQQVKLMLRAFNGECDAAVSKVRYNNVVSLKNRIQKSYEAINKLGETKKITLDPGYCKLKFDELHLSHEYQEKRQEEKEEHQRIREQMKEEEKVAKEIEKARLDAERDEAMKAAALERARQELALSAGQQTAKLEMLVSKLENELKDALDRKAKAIARAQLTRSGHVYILSNIGTFGENVYKIGLTRRLEPLERVKELGGASVPFPFDVHAMIYSEDAPKLENTLHKHFASRRINLINLRREFFRVNLDEIRAAVADHFGHVTFVTVAEAKQYRQTVAKLKEIEKNPASLQIA